MNISFNLSWLSKVVVFAVSFIVLNGNSLALPSASDGQKLLETEIQRRSNGLIKLVSFNKTNGIEGQVNGIRFYMMDYTAVVEFTENCMVSNSAQGTHNRFKTVRGQPTSELESFNPRFAGMRKAAKGEHMNVSGKFEFTKTEKGWRTGNEPDRDQQAFESDLKSVKTILIAFVSEKEHISTLDTVISTNLSKFKGSISAKKIDGATLKLQAVSPSLNGATVYMRASADRSGSGVTWKCRTESSRRSLCQGFDPF